ncbi:hypothetical protein KI387_013822, partial [Taxus chinensis]
SRREARKAFLALAQKDGPLLEKTSVTQNESLKDDKMNKLEEDDDNTVHVPRSAP